MEIDDKILIDNFRCPICWEIVEEPNETICCGNLFCEKCILSYLSSKCPMCRAQNFKFRKNAFAKKLLNEYEGNFICPYGCNQKIKLKDFKEHKYNCENVTFKCTINKCNFEGKRNNSLEHLVKNHQDTLLLISENYQDLKEVFNKFDIFNKMIKKNNIDINLNNNFNEDKKCK